MCLMTPRLEEERCRADPMRKTLRRRPMSHSPGQLEAQAVPSGPRETSWVTLCCRPMVATQGHPCCHRQLKARSRGPGWKAAPLPLSAGTPAQTERTRTPQGEGPAQVRSRGPGCEAAPLPLSGDAAATPRELNPLRGRTWLRSERRSPRDRSRAQCACAQALSPKSLSRQTS